MPISSITDDCEYIFAKSIPEPNSGCWLWTGSVNGDGYGTAWRPLWAKKYQLSHRVAYKAFKCDPKEKVVAHKCDNPICCNPDHLFAATQKENMKDASEKNRIASAERSGKAKLNWDVVEYIRQSDMSSNQLAKKFSVNQKTIWAVKNNKTWIKGDTL